MIILSIIIIKIDYLQNLIKIMNLLEFENLNLNNNILNNIGNIININIFINTFFNKNRANNN